MASNFDSNPKSFKDASFNLPMITDKRTEMYVKFAKVMLILQGPATDNRRHLVSLLENNYKYSCRVISDESYKKETNFCFMIENTEDFHKYFKDRVKKACEEGYNLIVIDQSLSNSNQISYYKFLAQAFQYVILPVPQFLTEKHESSSGRPTQNQATSLRGDTSVVYRNMFKHLFCGWFLHDVDSAELREEANLYALDCFDIREFDDMFSQSCKPHNFKKHYNMENVKQDIACCIVKVLESPTDALEYTSKESFQRYYGGMSKLYVVGFIISPHIIAARVKLTHDQKQMWAMPDDLPEKHNPRLFPSELLKGSKISMPSESVSLLASKSNRTLISGKPIHEPMNSIPYNAKGRSCHILLGKVKNAPERNVDCDVPFAVFRERSVVPKYTDNVEPYDLSRCLVRRIGKYWFVYLKETIIINGFFATCCAVESNVA